MLFQARLVEVVLLAAFEDTLEVATAVGGLMNLKMLFQVAPRGKPLSAVRTFEGFITRVDALVPDQVRNLGEGLGAPRMVTGVGLLLVVDSGMLLQR